MQLTDLRDILLSKMSYRDQMTMDTTFAIRAEEAFRVICQKTMPLALTDSDPNGREVIRIPLPHTYILKHPTINKTLTEGEIDGTQEIMLEEELVYAAASFMATKYEPQNKNDFFAQMWDSINNHRKTLLDSPYITDSEAEYQHGFI
jgi:hypothetical protein